jgi:hypothetical protein
MANKTQSATRKRIIAYDDDAMAIRDRYVGLARDNDVQLVYFAGDGNEQAGRAELIAHGVPKELAGLATILRSDATEDLGLGLITEEQSGIPFPQDADQYIVDGLNYFREGKNEMEIGRTGFVAIASRLPKNRVIIMSLDHHTREDAKKLGYEIRKEF